MANFKWPHFLPRPFNTVYPQSLHLLWTRSRQFTRHDIREKVPTKSLCSYIEWPYWIKRKDSDESDFGWIKVTHKKSRKQSTLKSFLVTKNTRRALAEEIQQPYFRPSQNSYPSQSQRQDNKATSVSPSTNDSHKGNKQTASTSTSSNTLSYLYEFFNVFA